MLSIFSDCLANLCWELRWHYAKQTCNLDKEYSLLTFPVSIFSACFLDIDHYYLKLPLNPWYSFDWNSSPSTLFFVLKGCSPWSETCQNGATNRFGNCAYREHNTYLKKAAVHLPANLSLYSGFLEAYISLMGFLGSIRNIYWFWQVLQNKA